MIKYSYSKNGLSLFFKVHNKKEKYWEKVRNVFWFNVWL